MDKARNVISLTLGAILIILFFFWIAWMVNYQLLGQFLWGLEVEFDPDKLWRSSLVLTLWFWGVALNATLNTIKRR